MSTMYILIDLTKKTHYTATGLKQISIRSGYNYNTLVSYLRTDDLHITDKLILLREKKIYKMNRKGNMNK